MEGVSGASRVVAATSDCASLRCRLDGVERAGAALRQQLLGEALAHPDATRHSVLPEDEAQTSGVEPQHQKLASHLGGVDAIVEGLDVQEQLQRDGVALDGDLRGEAPTNGGGLLWERDRRKHYQQHTQSLYLYLFSKQRKMHTFFF